MRRSISNDQNRFTLSEWAGALGDLGIMLPIAFALVIFNGFPPQRLFFLWGLTYIITGWYYGVPIAVQPLKVMAVIAIAAGYSVSELASAAFFYGLFMILLSLSGMIRILEQLLTPPLVRGVQLGIGLILLQRSLTMMGHSGFYFGMEAGPAWLNALFVLLVILVLGLFQLHYERSALLWIIFLSIGFSVLFNVPWPVSWKEGAMMQFQRPDMAFLWPAFVYLMLPQLPLTLGNAVFASCNACHTYWPERSHRVHPVRLGLSMGLSNILIGLSGGFPICHGAGGIAAHAKFGGKTGGTTIIMGGILVLLAILTPLTGFLFYIPIPVLCALLIFTSGGLIVLTGRLKTRREIIVAIIVGGLSFLTRNLTIAIFAGLMIEFGSRLAQKRLPILQGEKL